MNNQIAAMYARGEPISKIIEATGSTAIYTALRKEGIRPSRHARNDLLAALVKASGGSYLTTIGHTEWRRNQLADCASVVRA